MARKDQYRTIWRRAVGRAVSCAWPGKHGIFESRKGIVELRRSARRAVSLWDITARS
jgi:hypothetical protein